MERNRENISFNREKTWNTCHHVLFTSCNDRKVSKKWNRLFTKSFFHFTSKLAFLLSAFDLFLGVIHTVCTKHTFFFLFDMCTHTKLPLKAYTHIH